MSDLQTLVGTIAFVERNIQVPKRTGGSYPGTIVTYQTASGMRNTQAFTTKTLEFNQELAADIEALLPGQEVTFCWRKNDKGFKDYVSIKQGASAAPTTQGSTATTSYSSRSGGNDYTTGAIKGNTVTNAIHLAVARHGAKVTNDQLIAAADDVLYLHAYVESKDVMATIAEHKKFLTPFDATLSGSTAPVSAQKEETAF